MSKVLPQYQNFQVQVSSTQTGDPSSSNQLTGQKDYGLLKTGMAISFEYLVGKSTTAANWEVSLVLPGLSDGEPEESFVLHTETTSESLFYLQSLELPEKALIKVTSTSASDVKLKFVTKLLGVRR
jgi:hypothetical protein